MDKTLLGISGSPRKHGNCELFIREIHKQLGSGWRLDLVSLPGQDIKPCKACYQCLYGQMRCPRDDGFLPVLDALAGADAYAVVAPAYLLSANSSLKKFIDRGLQFYAYLDRLWGKPAVGVAVAGIVGMEGSTRLNVESFVKMTFGDLRGAATVYGALPGEALLPEENRECAARLAEALADAGKRFKPASPVCPLCGGDTFRLLPEGGARCMLCSGTGRYAWEDGRLSIHIEPGEHMFCLTKEEAARHLGWLREMKDRYPARRSELKEVLRRYLFPK